MIQDDLPDTPSDQDDPLFLARLVEKQLIEDRSQRYRHEPDHVFHPSMLGYCRRVMYNRAANLTRMDRYVKGVTHEGTRQHFWMEHHLDKLHTDRHLETEVAVDRRVHFEDGTVIVIKGEADVIDSRGIVYDHKFTGSLNYVQDEPKDEHVRQLHAYMYASRNAVAQLEYHLRDGKQNGDYLRHTVTWDSDTFRSMMRRARDVLDALRDRDREGGIHNNPFDHCGCFFGQEEQFREEAQPYNEVNHGE